MAPRRNSDVQLIIRAKDEAEKTIVSVADALEQLLSAQAGVATSAENTSSKLDLLAKGVLALDKAYVSIDGAANRASAAFERQQNALADSRANLAAVQAQAAGAARAIEQLQIKIVDTVLQGGDTAPLIAQIGQIQRAYAQLEKEQTSLTRSIAQQEGALNGQRSTLQQIGSTATAVEDRMRDLEAATELETAALLEQADAAERVTRVQQQINRLTGVSRPDAGGSAERSAEILRVAEARDHEIIKLREQEQATYELARAQEAQERSARFLSGGATGKSAKESAAVFQAQDIAVQQRFEDQMRANAQAAKEMDAAADRLRGDLDPLRVTQDRLNQELAEADKLYKSGRISATELAQATQLLRGRADQAAKSLGTTGIDSRGRPSLFGLKPYELQNLSYQINDVFTQLASGTSLTQTLAQQGGQLLQLFPRLGAAIATGLTSGPVLLLVAAFASLALGIREVMNDAERLRNFDGMLRSSADAATYQAQALADASEAIERYGLSADDAVAAVRTFVREGVNPARIVEFAAASQNLADVLGIEVTDAAKQVADAFTGGFEAIDKLDEATNFLTAAQREEIRTLFDAGRAQDARTRALEIFTGKMDDAATKMRGSWTDATRSLGNAWDSFINLIANSAPVTGMASALDTLGRSVASVLNRLSGTQTVADITFEIERAYRRIGELNESISTTGDPFGFKQQQINEYVERIKGLNADLEKLQKRATATAGTDTMAADTERQKKVDEDIRRSDAEKLASAKELSHEKRLQLAYETALRDAQDKGASEAAALASAENARLIEKRKIEKEITQEREKQRRAEEQIIKSFTRKVPGIEATGNANATNPNSSATGLGQFIESTWLKLFRENFPDRAANMSRETILALRTDAEISKQMIDIYARDNAALLKKAGESVTEANLYLVHFLGPQGALKVIKAAADTSVSALLNQQAVNANKSVLGGGKSAGDVRAWAARKVGETTASEGAVEARLVELERDRLKLQTQFNESVDDELDKRRLAIDSLKSQQGLIGEALIAEERKQAIADAVLKRQQEIDKINVRQRLAGQQEIEFSDAQRRAVEETTGAYFDLARAKDVAAAKRESVERPVNDLAAQRRSIQEQVAFYQLSGQGALASELEPQLTLINKRLDEAIEKAVAFWRAVQEGAHGGAAAFGLTNEQIEVMIQTTQRSSAAANDMRTRFMAAGDQINQSIAGQATNALKGFAQAVANGANVVSSLGDAFLAFAADFLIQIAEMIIMQQIFNAVSAASGNPSGGGGFGGGFSAFLAGLFHEGGVVGKGGTQRPASPSWFANAQRFHEGGLPGLRPNEVAAVLEKGEEVLTRDDPRHVLNGGGAGGAGGLRQVLAFGDEEIAGAMMGRAGEQVTVTHIRRNKTLIRQELGIA